MTKQYALKEISKDQIDFLGYTNTIYFDRFLKKVDRTGQSTLVKELFGNESAYIDTAGDYDSVGTKQEMSITAYEEANGYDVEAIFKWYCENFEKAWRWMFPQKLSINQRQTENKTK